MKLFSPFLLACFTGSFHFLCAEPYDPSRFEKEVLVGAANDAIQMEVFPNGDILFVEFWGTVKYWDAETRETSTLGKIPTKAKGEIGMLGMAADRDFLNTGHFYVLFTPEKKADTMRVSRFTVKEGKLDLGTEAQLLDWPYDTEHIYHMGGAMWMDGKGDLYIGNGDNCHWNPGLPVDFREGRVSWDAFRSAANSRDLRGKILRIHPEPDGTYTNPKDNLFPDGKDGRQEIYCMGIRNPFRISVDDPTGTLYIADVGPNVMPKLGVEPVGYEELNATTTAGNFGWPAFIGPNETLPLFDFDNNKEIERQDPAKPTNRSPNNNGIKNLPPAKPAMIWFNNLPSKLFPAVGSGGRSIMAGPVYRYEASCDTPIKFPKELDGHLFLYEWMRNWIATVSPESGKPDVAKFLPDWNFRRPIDMKFGYDGALYMVEYGDQWWHNQDSRIVRIVYRRGNRPPVADIAASQTAGRQPLTIQLSAGGSTDPDGDELGFSWKVDGKTVGEDANLPYVFKEAGTYEVTLDATDSNGLTNSTATTIHVGNARPDVQFASPAHGSFFDWKEEIPYKVKVADVDSPDVKKDLVSVQGQFLGRRFDGKGNPFVEPGLQLMRESTCFSCHLSTNASGGPTYGKVSEKYADVPHALETLAGKVINGGTGVWGKLPMPAHPQHTQDQARQMVAWILSLGKEDAPKAGLKGKWVAPEQPKGGARANEGVLILTAGYTDAGADGAPPLRGESTIVLHSRKKKAALYDANHGMDYVEQVEGERGILGLFEKGDHITWKELNLKGIKSLLVRAGGLGEATGSFELRQGTPEGKLLARVKVPATGEGEYKEIEVKLRGKPGLTDVCVVAKPKGKSGVLGLNWIEFKE